MGDIMRPVPFGELLNRIFEEYKASRSILVSMNGSFTAENISIL